MQVQVFNWSDVDQAARSIIEQTSHRVIAAVCGIPRGGLPLAVKVSHLLGVPMVYEPGPDVLLIDDIHDSGQTLEQWRVPGCICAVWVTREDSPDRYFAAETGIGDQWVVFPWEDLNKAGQDCADYLQKRSSQ